MSSSFFKPSKDRSSPYDLVKALRQSLLALDTETVAKCSFRYLLESTSFELFFKYVELPNFDVASDALATFKGLLTKHETAVAQFLGSHYEQFFELYEKLLTSTNYVTRRQSLKVFVANPNKPCEIIEALANNHAELLMLLHNLPASKGEDEQLEEERDLIIKKIERLLHLSQVAA